LSTGDPNVDSEDGHPIAYSAILQAAQSYERPPLFLREDHEQITSDPVMAENGPVMLTQAQVAAQKAGAQKRAPPRSQSPVGGSSDDDDPARADEWIWSQTKGCLRRNKFYKAPIATDPPEKVTSTPPPLSSPAPIKAPSRPPTPVSVPAVPPSPKGKKSATKAAASQKAPAAQKPVPEAKASKPVETRSKTVSRAGGLRSVGG
jgi:hypothetical protein